MIVFVIVRAEIDSPEPAGYWLPLRPVTLEHVEAWLETPDARERFIAERLRIHLREITGLQSGLPVGWVRLHEVEAAPPIVVSIVVGFALHAAGAEVLVVVQPDSIAAIPFPISASQRCAVDHLLQREPPAQADRLQLGSGLRLSDEAQLAQKGNKAFLLLA